MNEDLEDALINLQSVIERLESGEKGTRVIQWLREDFEKLKALLSSETMR